jgi:DNA-binding transcriptional regulator LsrR (DeoR family)
VVADPSRAAAVVGALRAGTTTDLVIDEGTALAVAERL